ncbi:neuropeptide FF receptor 1-like [Asterias amurensis]|uniref:neuropeptide FF receptor 1-like n=1 Tax=Asterias amurensis TaxID=7602 RepID=UPI003AB2A810
MTSMDFVLNATDWDPTSTTRDIYGVASITWDWFFIVQLILALFGIFGNILVIVVYVKKLRNRSNSNKLIVMLAVADLITSVAIIPLPSLTYVPNSAVGRVYCIFTYSAVIMWMSIVASIFILTLLSLERYFAVVHPLKHKLIFSKNRIKCFIAAIWTAAIVMNSGSFFVTRVSEGNNCELTWPSSAFQMVHGSMIFTVEFVIPVTLMVVSHFRAIRELQMQARSLLKRNESTSSPAFSLLRCRRRVIKMVLIVVLTFIICWLPDQMGFLLFNFGVLSPDYFRSTIYRAFTILAFINSCANPIIYVWLNKNFRAAVAQLIPFIRLNVRSNSAEEGTMAMSVAEARYTGPVAFTNNA